MSGNESRLKLEVGGELNSLLAASRTVIAAAAAAFHPGVQPAAYQLALMLAARGLRASELADRLDMDRSAISRLSKFLVDNSLVQSSTDPNDGRGVIFELTKDGRDRMEASKAIKSDAFFSRLEGWSDEDLDQFVRLLRRFNLG